MGELLLVSPAVTSFSDTAAEDEMAEPVVALMTTGDRGYASRWQVAPHLEVQAAFNDNIFIQPRHKVADFIFTIAPGVAFGLWDSDESLEHYREREGSAAAVNVTKGNYFVFDCTGIFLGFARNSSQNSVDGDAQFRGQWEQAKLTLGTAAHAESKSETSRDVGDRIRTTTVTGEVTVRYEITEKSALEAGVYERLNDPEGYLRSLESRVEGFFDSAVTPLLRLGVGAALGEVEVESRGSDRFERVLGRAVYAWDETLETVLVGGVEFRQADKGDGGENAIFDLRTAWTNGTGTGLAVGAFRHVETSASFFDHDFVLTGVNLAFRHVMNVGVQVSFDGGYDQAEYASTRNDAYFYLRPGLLYNFTRWGNIGMYYEFRRNRSNAAESSFENNQVSVKLGLAY